ncbi:MAG: hypothetical protein KDA45_06955 [Planctomycetales bacterium]|nr:hypothetical protein [Planctomycetales bacterium]
MNRMEAVKRRHHFVLLGFLGTLLLPAVLQAEGLLHRCERCGVSCQPQVLVEKTILCPVKVIETRLKPCLVETCEEREEKYTAFKCVPEKRIIKKECCYLLDEVKSKEITEKDCKLVDINVARAKNVLVPQYEMAETCVQKQVCTRCGPVCVEECCLEEKARMIPGVSVEQDCEKQLVFAETQREIFYCVKTPKKHTIECAEETVYKLEPVEQTRKVKVTVPKIEYRPYEVEVVKMLPKKVACCVRCSHHTR